MKKTLTDFALLNQEMLKFEGDGYCDKTPKFFPSFIPGGEGKSYRLSRSADKILTRICDALRESETYYSDQFARQEFRGLVRTVVGNMLFENGGSFGDDVGSFLCQVQCELKLRSEKNDVVRSHAFGVTLIHPACMQSIRVGPVKLVEREEWLTHKREQGQISDITFRRILRTWGGEKLRSRVNSSEAEVERYLLEAIGSGLYVAEVQTKGASLITSRRRAKKCARLALVTLALCWEDYLLPMNEFRLEHDRDQRCEVSVYFDEGGNYAGMQARNMRQLGQYIEDIERLTEVLGERNDVNRVIGGALEVYASSSHFKNQRVSLAVFECLDLMNRAALEEDPMFATALLGSALDILGEGRGSPRIFYLFEVFLEKDRDAELFSDGTTVKEFVEKVYKVARSGTWHGGNELLLRDWTKYRNQAAWIVKGMLSSVCVKRLEYPNKTTLSGLYKMYS